MKWTNRAGVTFVFGSYRQKITQKSPIQIRDFIKGELVSHGPYVALVGKREVIFNREPGISAGDFLLRQLEVQKHPNAIYCELLEESSGQFAVVIVHEGRVVADALCVIGETNKDIEIGLESYPANYTLILCDGITELDIDWFPVSISDGPLSSTTSIFKSKIDSTSASQYIHLDQLERAFEKAGISKKTSVVVPILVIAIVCAGIFWIIPKAKPVPKQDTLVIDPYMEYRAVILSGRSSVSTVLKSIILTHTYEIQPGWRLQQIDMNSVSYKATLVNLGGEVNQLYRMKSADSPFSISIDSGNVSVNGPVDSEARTFPYVIYRLSEIEAKLYDELISKMQYSIGVVSDIDKGNFMARQFAVSAKNINFVEIESIAYALIDLPIIVDSILIKPAETGYDISITLTAIGSKG